MVIRSLSLKNFRNFSDLEVTFSESLTVFIGKNGSGKTNILEGIRFLSISRSFRTTRDSYVIRWGEEYARILGEIEADKQKKQCMAYVEQKNRRVSKKEFQVNKISRKAVEMLGEVLTVLFTPEDIDLITAPPRERRRYLDMLLCQIDAKYCFALMEYKKILKNRNKILSDLQKGRSSEDLLELWDDKLIERGLEITKRREVLISYFNTVLSKMYQKMSGNTVDTLSLDFSPTVESDEDSFRDLLAIKRTHEIYVGHTLLGPHRDDFTFLLNEKDIAFCGSRGEFRTTILALKQAELKYVEEVRGEKPLLLLDDVLSELDAERQQQLFSMTKNRQTCITTTDSESLEGVLPKGVVVYEINNAILTKKD